MKIAVYTISLNEEKHVKRWFESAKDADLLVIADTGSTDKTRFIAKSLGISVTEIEVNPWRFDVARNASLALIPEDFDVCIQLDMDEVLPAGWRKKVEEAFQEGNTWPIYKHVTSRYPDGNPRNYQHYFKIHPRKGFYWKYPIHEVLAHLPELSFDRKVIDLEVDHIKDLAKPRNSYLGLLEKAVEEEPNDWRMNHYLNREYFYNRDWLKVLQSAFQCESIPGGWDIERASSYMWASEAAHHLKMTSLAEDWAKKATTAAPHFYEVWHWRAHIAHLHKKWPDCLDFASKRLILKRQDHHLVKPEVWEWWGYDLMALANHNLGNHYEAVYYGEKASFAFLDQRLKENLGFYRKSARSEKSNLTLPLDKSRKLQSFPKILIITIATATQRQVKLKNQLESWGLSDYKFIQGQISKDRTEKALQNAIFQSHIKAINYFIYETNLEWVVICEDDINFNMVEYWPFTWEDKLEHLSSHQIEIFQMCIMTSHPSFLETELHRRREGYDWSTAAYLLSRIGAEKILANKYDENQPVESNLFDGLETYSEALLICDTDNIDAFHFEHVNAFELSFEKAKKEMQSRSLN